MLKIYIYIYIYILYLPTFLYSFAQADRIIILLPSFALMEPPLSNAKCQWGVRVIKKAWGIYVGIFELETVKSKNYYFGGNLGDGYYVGIYIFLMLIWYDVCVWREGEREGGRNKSLRRIFLDFINSWIWFGLVWFDLLIYLFI